MHFSDSEKEALARAMRKGRAQQHLSLVRLAHEVAVRTGRGTSPQSVSAWEKGEYGPSSWDIIDALDAILYPGAPGTIRDALGAAVETDRQRQLRAQVRVAEARLEELREQARQEGVVLEEETRQPPKRRRAQP